MKLQKIELPLINYSDLIDTCAEGIVRNESLKNSLNVNRSQLIEDAVTYQEYGNTGKIYQFEPYSVILDMGPFPLDTVCFKDQFTKIYDSYFVPETKATRETYNTILNAAKDECPFCGGVGTPTNLDHFLPKAEFPQFSILPLNLVPACRDCNMGSKKVSYAKTEETQTIHPYLDHSFFFNEQWITAKYIIDDPDELGYLEYYVSCPSHWTDVNKDRALNHFKDFGIASRYAKHANSSIKSEVRRIKRQIDANVNIYEILKDHLLVAKRDSPFKNHYFSGFYDAFFVSLVENYTRKDGLSNWHKDLDI